MDQISSWIVQGGLTIKNDVTFVRINGRIVPIKRRPKAERVSAALGASSGLTAVLGGAASLITKRSKFNFAKTSKVAFLASSALAVAGFVTDPLLPFKEIDRAIK